MDFNPQDLSYGAMFLALLVYTIKSNDTREKKYQDTIESNQETIKEMVSALNDNTELKEAVKDIQSKIGVV